MTSMGQDLILPSHSCTIAGYQRWQHVLFLHWEVDPIFLQALLPEGLELDLYEGKAYVGVVPFLMRGARMSWSPTMPGISNFCEVNVRTYVRRRGAELGVWFFTMEASNLPAVMAARLFWRLPYRFASIRVNVGQARVGYHSRRQQQSQPAAELDIVYDFPDVAKAASAAPGSLEEFLVERYIMYVGWAPQDIRRVQVIHKPYLFCEARVEIRKHSLLEAAGFGNLTGTPVHAVYSPGVDVAFCTLRKFNSS